MKFIAVLIAVGLEHVIPQLDALRRFGWLRAAERWSTARFGAQAAWNGPLGVFVCVAVPLAAVAVLMALLGAASVVLAFLFGLAVLLYSLGPQDLSHQVEEYLTALGVGDEPAAQAVATGIVAQDTGRPSAPEEVARAILAEANERLFAVLVWFVVLGPIGALLYRLAALLARSPVAHPPAMREHARFLHACLAWFPARLLALGYALTGSLVHAFERWRPAERLGLEESVPALEEAGLGALQIDDPAAFCSADPANRIVLVTEIKRLVGRALFAWLTIYAALTIAGLR